MTLRRATADDLASLVRLAQLDSRRLPAGPYLVAEVDDRLVAAVVIKSGDVFADPFAASAEAAEMLRERAAQLRGDARPAFSALGAMRGLFPAVARRT
jgi:hypothetical protein